MKPISRPDKSTNYYKFAPFEVRCAAATITLYAYTIYICPLRSFHSSLVFGTRKVTRKAACLFDMGSHSIRTEDRSSPENVSIRRQNPKSRQFITSERECERERECKSEKFNGFRKSPVLCVSDIHDACTDEGETGSGSIGSVKLCERIKTDT